MPSIWKDQKHICSSLYLPELNDYIITGQKVEKFKSRIIGCSSSYNDEIGGIIRNNKETRIIGCCVYNSFNVIRGSYKQFINPKTYCWDLQASLMLAQEHSCKINLNGKSIMKLLAPNKRHCVFISTNDIFIIGKGPSIDLVSQKVLEGALVIAINDSDRIHKSDITIFYADWVKKSIENEVLILFIYYLYRF